MTYYGYDDVPPGWSGREPKHFDASDKATLPGRLSSKVVGLTFVGNYPQNLHQLRGLEDQSYRPRLFLRRNPGNAYDANAVEVRAEDPDSRRTMMLGHLPAALAARLAPEMDADDRDTEWVVVGWEVLVTPGAEDKPGLSLSLLRGQRPVCQVPDCGCSGYAHP